eukprot:TRINITY_DN4480_c0_g1_i1.p1 TRINITY_DN4480_c0_g1~~TRINITY_DN4480_c0_g1_i1.p1  ORF type:complete len:254 (-),score=34.98 TRINITY_DN4480_c0_g1_i1:316-1077(-)
MSRRCAVALLALGATAAEDAPRFLQNASLIETATAEEVQTIDGNATLLDGVVPLYNTSADAMPIEATAEQLETMDGNASSAILRGMEYAAGRSLGLTWEDCGGKGYFPMEATITGFTPNSLALGARTTLTGWGDLRSAVQGGIVDIHTRAGFVSRSSQADLCSAKTDDMPGNAGSVTWRGLNCPVAPGPVSILSDIELSRNLPRFFLRATVTITATAWSGAPLFCLKVKVSPSRRLQASDPEAADRADDTILV